MRPFQPIEPETFRRARRFAGLDVERCAALLHVTARTIRNWESGHSGIPYPALRLLRVLHGQELPGEEWEGWYFHGRALRAPNGDLFDVRELQWLSHVFLQAGHFKTLYFRVAELEREARLREAERLELLELLALAASGLAAVQAAESGRASVAPGARAVDPGRGAFACESEAIALPRPALARRARGSGGESAPGRPE